jgi:hypothetical protein
MDQPRAKSACDDCGVTDDLPRHHVMIGDPEALPDGLRVESRHFRCCADRGCPDGTCDQILAQGQVA